MDIDLHRYTIIANAHVPPDICKYDKGFCAKQYSGSSRIFWIALDLKLFGPKDPVPDLDQDPPLFHPKLINLIFKGFKNGANSSQLHTILEQLKKFQILIHLCLHIN